MNNLVGLENVKIMTKRIIASAVVDRQRRKEGCGYGRFYQWMAQFGANMKIEGPGECVESYVKFVRGMLAQY